jgi:hypothetical protein
MPKVVEQPVDIGPLPRLNTEKQARVKLGLGQTQWVREREKIATIRIGASRRYTDRALAAYLKANTHRPAA